MINSFLIFMVILYRIQNAIILPPQNIYEKQIAVIWIHGANCKAEAYISIAKEFQKVALSYGYSAWIGIPQFNFQSFEITPIDQQVQQIFNEMKEDYGFIGNKYYLSSHSLGGVMAQIYAKDKRNQVSGLILTCQLLLDNTKKITDNGTTIFDYNIPVLTLVGEIDGLLRISKSAELYWHQQLNIDEAQKGLFPLLVLEGMSHASFMDRKMLPPAVLSLDINPEVEEKKGHNMVGIAMIEFIQSIEHNYIINAKNIYPINRQKTKKDLIRIIRKRQKYISFQKYTDLFMRPIIEAMNLEGSYKMKEACNSQQLINQKSVKCLVGSPWSQYAQKIMGGKISNKNAEIQSQDNFHPIYPHSTQFLPKLINSCPINNIQHCILQSINVTENLYNQYNLFSTYKYEVGAAEMKVKLISRQQIQQKSGNTQADFHETDEVGSRCADINKLALKWALQKSNQKAIDRYNKYGKKLVIGDDIGPYNDESLWLWEKLTYKENIYKTCTLVQSPTLRTPIDYSIGQLSGFHFCKLLSPFRVIEWIYHDSQLDHNSIRQYYQQLIYFQQSFYNIMQLLINLIDIQVYLNKFQRQFILLVINFLKCCHIQVFQKILNPIIISQIEIQKIFIITKKFKSYFIKFIVFVC